LYCSPWFFWKRPAVAKAARSRSGLSHDLMVQFDAIFTASDTAWELAMESGLATFLDEVSIVELFCWCVPLQEYSRFCCAILRRPHNLFCFCHYRRFLFVSPFYWYPLFGC
jgi:hypothetical protein